MGEDYGTMAYSMAIMQREVSELRSALVYLLWFEATGFSGAPLGALLDPFYCVLFLALLWKRPS
ncbi:MAG: hypothetical protein OXE92_05715 [Bacteroidetes bacterium]|nr:hypothetical protein [Bacteroidota bacterium]MCY4205206.1 hypothetical protein [Bacteroidota bacterium]